mgnify:CR=1 FL=1
MNSNRRLIVIKKYGSCKFILIGQIANRKSAILLQNAFSILEKYINHVHTVNGAFVRVADNLKDKILNNFNSMLAMKKEGINLFSAE